MNKPIGYAVLLAELVCQMHSAGAVAVNVDVGDVRTEIQYTIYGTCMEDVNHEIYGGLDAQRLYDESFEEA